MGLFSTKERVNLEKFCGDWYEKYILHPVLTSPKGDLELAPEMYEVFRKNIVEADANFEKVDLERFSTEIVFLRFELFALAWMHKFGGNFAVAQSIFTKRYLQEKKRNDIWEGMRFYNKYLNSGVLHWLTSLGKVNMPFWYNMIKSLSAKNIEEGKKIGISDENIEMVNNRLCSENAWKQRWIFQGLVSAVEDKFGFILNDEAEFRLAVVIRGLYDGARQSFDNIKIEK